MRYRILHRTTYAYTEPAALSQNELCLTPRTTERQRCETSVLTVVPEPSAIEQRTDCFGNRIHHFMVQEPHRELVITADSSLTVSDPPPLPASSPAWERVRDRLRRHETDADLDAYPYTLASPFVPAAQEPAEYASSAFAPGRPLLEAARALTKQVHAEFRYEKGATSVGTTVMEVLRARRGVCQDFAHLQIACLRSLGLAARYVSGYLETTPPPGQAKLVGTDASHAWLALYLPDAGWIELDPTNDVVPGSRHVQLAWGRDYGDVTPVKGVTWGGGEHRLRVEVDVLPL